MRLLIYKLMKKYLCFFTIILCCATSLSQNSNNSYPTIQNINYSYLTYLGYDVEIKNTAKEIAQFRAKEFIINNIIGSANAKDIKFETESLASDDSAGLVSVAYNCDEIQANGLLLAFVGWNKNADGIASKAYGFRAIPLDKAKLLLQRIDKVRGSNNNYLSANINVNNVYIEFEDIKFVIYKDGGSKIRVFWNGFEIVWEDTAFTRSKRRLDKWFK